MIQPCPACGNTDFRIFVTQQAWQSIHVWGPSDGEYGHDITHEDVTKTTIHRVECRNPACAWADEPLTRRQLAAQRKARKAAREARLPLTRALRAMGFTYKEIGARLGVHATTVFTALAKADGDERSDSRKQHKARALSQTMALRAQGLSYTAIGAKLGLHPSYVWKLMHDQAGTMQEERPC